MGQEDVTNAEEENNVREELSPPNEEKRSLNHEYIRSKMEVMQKRIEELKDKVKLEGEFLHGEEATLKENISDDKFEDSLSDLKDNLDQDNQESETSLYFSASNYSLCSLSSNSTDSAYYNFTAFINNFVKNQNQKERVSLLQLHSKKQISLNMMKHSLTELDYRCSEELELIEKNLQHLNRLAAEFNVTTDTQDKGDCQLKTLELYSGGGDKVRSNQTIIWQPLSITPSVQFNWNNSLISVKNYTENSSNY